MRDSSKVIKCHDFRWEAVAVKEYKAAGAPFKDVTRQTLLGEGAGEEALDFIVRYFEVQPGGYSTLERHQHPHAVVILRGTGRVVLGERSYAIAPYDCVYVAPGMLHQFQATGGDPLGFLCTVDRVRDRPQLPSEEELRAMQMPSSGSAQSE
jgi:quercetin dioxygenase-like cupin family protein